MKLLMMIVDESKKEELEVLLGRVGVRGYTELPNAVGVGTSGPRLGSGAFPKTSAVVFSVVDDGAKTELVRQIREYCTECGEKLRMIAWDVEELL
jgi:hypothetical protein